MKGKSSKLAKGFTPNKAKRRPGGGQPSPVKKISISGTNRKEK